MNDYNLENCNRCGRCLGVCPLYLRMRDEYYSPRGFIQLILNGRYLGNAQKRKLMRYCTNCFNCSEICQNEVKIAEFLHESIVK